MLEHPEASHAFAAHGIARPEWRAGWMPAGDKHRGRVCCIAQGNYGHRARKLTWLYAVGVDTFCAWSALDFSIPAPRARLDVGFHSAAERANDQHRAKAIGAARLGTRENLATPIPFRDLLLTMARSVPSVATAEGAV